jgi:hypothetical protein
LVFYLNSGEVRIVTAAKRLRLAVKRGSALGRVSELIKHYLRASEADDLEAAQERADVAGRLTDAFEAAEEIAKRLGSSSHVAR